MKRRFTNTSSQTISQIDSSHKGLLEKALQMRCEAYLAENKALLLMETIVEVERSRKELKSVKGSLEEMLSSAVNQNDELSREINARKIAEDRLEKARKAAVAANKSKSQFLSNVSHDLRSPIGTILGYSELIDKKFVSDKNNEELGGYNQNIAVAAGYLLQMLDELLDLGQIEAGKLVIREGSFAVSDLVSEACEILHHIAAVGNHELIVDIADDISRLKGDQLLLKRALINLMSNAIKFSKPDGDVHLTIRKNEANNLEICVADTGIGIAPDRINAIMEPFGRSYPDSGDQFITGTGLGLPISRSIIELHGGSLELESEPGKGTRVTCLLPESRIL